MHRPRRPQNRGFALLELIIVIVLIALFAAFFWRTGFGNFGFGGAADAPTVNQGEGALNAAKQVQQQVNARSAAEQQQFDQAQ